MEFDIPVRSTSPHREGRKESTTIFTDLGGTTYQRPVPGWEGPHRMQSPMGPGPFVRGYSANARPPGTLPAPSNGSTRVAEMSLSPQSLAINSRHAQPPLSWRQEYPVCPNSSQCPQRDLRRVAPAVRSRSSTSRHDDRRTRGMVSARARS
jgi:hypothetical protein